MKAPKKRFLGVLMTPQGVNHQLDPKTASQATIEHKKAPLCMIRGASASNRYYIMKKSKPIYKISENISLATPTKSRDNKNLSQNELAVMPNGLNWLFYCLQSNKDKAIPPYTDHHTAKGVLVRLPFMVWLILQNKPFGEYVKRLLLIPRVRPHRPNTGFSTQNLTGAFPC